MPKAHYVTLFGTVKTCVCSSNRILPSFGHSHVHHFLLPQLLNTHDRASFTQLSKLKQRGVNKITQALPVSPGTDTLDRRHRANESEEMNSYSGYSSKKLIVHHKMVSHSRLVVTTNVLMSLLHKLFA